MLIAFVYVLLVREHIDIGVMDPVRVTKIMQRVVETLNQFSIESRVHEDMENGSEHGSFPWFEEKCMPIS